ncbi:hypothetical protein ACE6H2_010301 [Prunus campanulata]
MLFGHLITSSLLVIFSTFRSNSSVFNFDTNANDVLQVPTASFDSCSLDNAIGSPITRSPANVTLTSAGDNYFICTKGTNCQFSQKLAITVSPSAPTSEPPPPPPTAPPTTPSPSSNDPAACAPVPSPSPSTAGGPTVKATPGSSLPPDNSSSPAVVAGFSLSYFSLVIMGLFF